MAFYDKFPYTNFQEINLDKLIDAINEQNKSIAEFFETNKIKFSDPLAWNIGSQYEANTVVMDPDTRIAYLSTKAVPSGVAITNTDYWTSIFDASVFINPPRYVVAISDSYGVHGSSPWTTIFPTYARNIGTYRYFAEGSAGFNREGHAGHTFKTLLQANIDSLEPSAVTDIIVAGGANDALAVAVPGLPDAIDDFCDYVHSTFPNAKICISFIGHTFAQNYAELADEKTAFAAYSERAGANGAAFWRNAKWIMHDPHNVESDRVHPNTQGMQLIAEALASYYNDGGFEYVRKYNINITGPYNIETPGSAPAMFYTIQNDQLSIHTNQFRVSMVNIPAAPSETVWLTSEILLGSSNDILATRPGYGFVVPVSWSAADNIPDAAVPALLSFAQANVYLYLRYRAGATNARIQSVCPTCQTVDIMSVF